jgi:TRAP-type C4-dicarboxylate transport system permease small subunit
MDMFYRTLNKIIKVLTIACLSVITIFVSVEVILRYFFGGTLYITEQLTRYLLVWMVFLASSLAIADNSHIYIEILVNRVHGRTRACFNLVAQALLLFFLLFLMIEGIVVLPFQVDQIISTLGVSIIWFYLAIPVGSLLMIVNLLPKIWGNLRALSSKTAIPESEGPAPGAEQGGFL